MSIFDSSGAFANIDMSYGDHSSYPALGFNPAPGNTGTVGTLARTFSTVAGHLGQAHDALAKAGQAGGFWQGEAARAFHDDVGELPDYLAKATSSFGAAGTALDGWVNDLTSLQQSAADYERQAEQAQRTLNQAKSNPDLQLAGQEFDTDQTLRQAQARLDTATAELTQAEAELRAIRKQAARLYAQHQDLVHEVEAALKRAKDKAPDEPGLLDRIGNAIGGLIDGAKNLAGKVWQWTKDHANVIKKIGDVLSKASAVLGIIAVATAGVEPIGAIFGAAAGVTAVGALAAHGIAKAAGAQVSWTSMGMDALGAVPFIGGVARGAKVADAGIEGAGAIGRASEVASGLGKTGATVRFGPTGDLLAEGAQGASTAFVKGEGAGGRLLVAGEGKIINGQLVGTQGYNKILDVIDKSGSMSRIDPLTTVGQSIDTGMGAMRLAGSEAYHNLTGGDHSHSPASDVFRARAAARGGA
ncbi:MAG: putative T7SS-secreted protein [Sciscionella sp.]